MISFCDSFTVEEVVIEQRTVVEGGVGDWVTVFEGTVGQRLDRLDTLRLPSGATDVPSVSRLSEIDYSRGTQFYVGVRDGVGGGFSGQFESPGDSWASDAWLPTQGPLSQEPCAHWDALTR